MSTVADSGVFMQAVSMSTSTGGSLPPPQDIPEFIDLPEKYICIVCGQVLRNAMQLPCGHQLCESPCVNDLLDKMEKVMCPVREEECNTPFDRSEVFKDVCTRKEVLLLKVYCKFKKLGCKEKLPWRNLTKHTEKCEFRETHCPNEGCDEIVPANQLEEHKDKLCLFRPIICKHCELTVPECEMKKHEQITCKKFPVSCPNKCGVKDMPREEMEVHKGNCPKAPRKCSYWTIGCEFQGLDKEVSEHEKTAADHHLRKVIEFTNKTSDQNQVLAEEMEKIRTERDELKKTVDAMHEANRKMKAEVDKFNKEFVKEIKRKMVTLTERVIHLERGIQNLPSREIVERQERELNALKEDQTTVQERINRVERAGPVGGINGEATGNLMTQMKQNEKQLAIQDIRLAELDLRFQVLETANFEGVLMWKIREYTRRKQEAMAGRTLSLYSQPFYTSRYGYKMCARIYLNGDGMGRGTHLSLFFVVMRGEYDALLTWPFQHRVSLMLLDQQDGRRTVSDTFQPDPTSSSFIRPTTEMNIATGCPLFVAHSVLETNTYLRDDTIFIKVKVTENNTDRALEKTARP